MNLGVVFHSHSNLQFPSFLSFGRQPRLGRRSIYFLKDIADGALIFNYQQDIPQSTALSLRSDGHRGRGPPRRRSASRRRKEDENETTQSSNGKKSNSSNQEEIIALFRRIQSSITKGESFGTKKRNSNLSEDRPASGSILEVLRNSRKQVKGKTPTREADEGFTGKRGVLKEEKAVQESPQVMDLKSARPPSKFVKRSPIPSSSTRREQVIMLNDQTLEGQAGSKNLGLPRMEVMKLTELKEVAKSRGMKGYSKLKKKELIELLS